MTSLLVQRATRRLIRPLRQKFFAKAPTASLDELVGPVLVLIAHPDDEVFCSGLICQLRSRGTEVHLVCFTRGEGGERGDLDPSASLAEVREQELTAAAEVLAVSSLTFLDYLDPASQSGPLAEPEHAPAQLLGELRELVSQKKARHLVTHGSSGEYWHPAHLCLHRHAKLLARRLPDLQLWTFNAWSPQHPLPALLNQDDQADLSLDASSHHDQRLAALTCHFSQQAVFQRFAQGTLSDFISLTSHEDYRKR